MGNNQVMVSVYCLAYNHEKYIRDALEGFVNQITDFKYEVYVHDDASTDNTDSIIREYEKKYPEIIHGIYQKENQYSKGINIFDTFIKEHMKGKYIAICEGDDYWCDSNKLQMQVDILEKNPSYSSCVHQTLKYNCNTGEKKELSFYNYNRFVELNDICTNWVFHTSSIVAKRELVIDQPEFCYCINGVGDLPLSIYMYLNGEIYYINKCMSVYRFISSETCWTFRMRQAPMNQKISVINQKIKMFSMADEYSHMKYHLDFDDGIKKLCIRLNQMEYINQITNHEKGIIKNPKFKEFVKKESFKSKIWIAISPYMPNRIINLVENK